MKKFILFTALFINLIYFNTAFADSVLCSDDKYGKGEIVFEFDYNDLSKEKTLSVKWRGQNMPEFYLYKSNLKSTNLRNIDLSSMDPTQPLLDYQGQNQNLLGNVHMQLWISYSKERGLFAVYVETDVSGSDVIENVNCKVTAN